MRDLKVKYYKNYINKSKINDIQFYKISKYIIKL